MKVYHFSDKYFDPDSFIPTGNFKKTISNASTIVTQFEQLMEEQRISINSSLISRLNCLFTFPINEAEGFKTNRKFLYELELTDDVEFSSHNYQIISYFEKLFRYNDIDLIKENERLIVSYWLNESTENQGINVSTEILVNKPLKILKTILRNSLSKQEFIDFQLPLYHITPTRNIENILEHGLKNNNGKGICFVQKKHPLVIQYIVETMLINEGDEEFSIIEIIPSKLGIQSNEIINDEVYEKTNVIHNYVTRNKIEISRENIIDTYTTLPFGIPNLTKLEKEIDDMGLLIPLN